MDIVAASNEATASFSRLGGRSPGARRANVGVRTACALGRHVARCGRVLGRKAREVVGEARLGDQNKQSLLQALGINPNDGRDAAEIFIDVAKAVAEMSDQNIAGKVTSDLLGKSFARDAAVPQGTVRSATPGSDDDHEQSREAKELEDNWIKLVQIEKQAARDLVAEVVPSLNKAAEAMQRVNQSHGWIDGIKPGFRRSSPGRTRPR